MWTWFYWESAYEGCEIVPCCRGRTTCITLPTGNELHALSHRFQMIKQRLIMIQIEKWYVSLAIRFHRKTRSGLLLINAFRNIKTGPFYYNNSHYSCLIDLHPYYSLVSHYNEANLLVITLWEIWNERGDGQLAEWENKQFSPDLKSKFHYSS